MTRPQVKLYLDVVSPFAYLAFHSINNSAVFQQCDITYIPVLLRGILKATGNPPPVSINNKALYLGKERLRQSKRYNIPMREKLPDSFPTNTLPALRALCALQMHFENLSHDNPTAQQENRSAEDIGRVIAALYEAYWVRGEDLGDEKVYSSAFKTVLGEELAWLVLEKIGDEGVKGRLQQNTDLAVEKGAFGVPYIEATNAEGETEYFFGFDHLGQVIEHLGLETDQKQAGLPTLPAML